MSPCVTSAVAELWPGPPQGSGGRREAEAGETPALGCARSLQWEQGWLIAELGPRGGFGPDPRTQGELSAAIQAQLLSPRPGGLLLPAGPGGPPQPELSRAPTRWLRAAPCPDTTAAGEPQHARSSRSLLACGPDMPGEGFPLRGKKPRTELPETSRPPRLRRTPRHPGHRSSAGFGCPKPWGEVRARASRLSQCRLLLLVPPGSSRCPAARAEPESCRSSSTGRAPVTSAPAAWAGVCRKSHLAPPQINSCFI